MDGLKVLHKTQIIILGLCFVLATVVSTSIFTKAVFEIVRFLSRDITVKGSAEKKIVSDYIVWSGAFSRRAPDLKTAYDLLEKDLQKVKAYLFEKGVREKELIVYPVDTRTLYKKTEKGSSTNEIEAYELSQSIEVRSNDVDKVDEISRRATELIKQDVEFISGSPKYFYTRLGELKIEMLAKATENARLRAATMAKAGGKSIGTLRSAKMGVFQITPVTSNDVSWYGNNDTSSLEKKVMAVATATFAIE